MRKTIFTALVTLLVMLAVVSCDSNLADADDGMVTLSIDTGNLAGNSRSLTTALAHEEGRYVEVIFKSTSGDYYRAQGYYGASIKINVPKGSYGPTNAIMLIGRRIDQTLLATGVPTTTLTVPDTTSNEIGFTVTSITTDLSVNGTDFTLTFPGALPAGWASGDIDSGVFAEDDAATICFQVPTAQGGIAAELAFHGFTTTGANIVVPTTPVPTVTFAKNYDPSPTITPTIAAITNMSGSALSFTFSSGPAGSKGYYIITFEIPVVGFSAVASSGGGPAAIIWKIRGGTKDDQPDFTGDAGDDPHRGIALVVKDSPSSTFGIIVKPSPITP